MSNARSVRGLRLSEHLYRAFLALFTAQFRQAHTADVIELFRDRYREVYRRAGLRDILSFLVRAYLDALWHGLMERWDERRAKIAAPQKKPTDGWFSWSFIHDLRYSFRNLQRSRGFTAIAVLTLAIGIGANTAIFSVANGVLLQPLPYDSPEDLVALYTYFNPESGRNVPKYAVGSPEYFEYLAQQESMESVAAISTEMLTITDGEGDPEIVIAGYVSSSMFSVLKAPPLFGRTLIAADDGAEPKPVFVLGYGLWQRRFGGDPSVIGQTIDAGLDTESEVKGEIVGIMPEDFAFPTPDTELWTPLPLDPARTSRGAHWFYMIARLAQDVTYEQAQAELKTLMINWAKVYPEHHTGHGLFMMPLLDDYVGNVRPAILLLLGAVGLVLLIACANVANLLLARGEGRRREVAVKSALGAGRWRLIQQLLTESLLLASLGGVMGVVLAQVGVDALLAIEGGSLPRLELIGLEGRVLVFTLGAVILTSLIFGLMPALQASSLDMTSAFKVGNRSVTASRQRTVFRKVLIVSEVALALILVIGAGLVTKSFRQLLRVDPGFRADHLLTARLSLPAADYSGPEAVIFYNRVKEELEALPEVESSAIVSRPPLYMDRSASRFHIEGRPDSTPDEAGWKASHVLASPGVFETLAIPLRRGRLLNETDRAGSQLTVVIDEEMARMYWPGEDPIGRKIRFARSDGPWHTIVGIVGKVKFDGLRIECPTYYHNHAQTATWADFHARTMSVVVRTRAEPTSLAGPLRDIVRSLDPNLAVIRIQTMEELVSKEVAQPRFLMTLIGVFASIALILGAIGVYGVISHGVAQRTHEIGIRMALGARGGEVARMVLRQGLGLSLLGVLAGLGAAYGATRFLSGLLFEVSPTDPRTYGAMAMIMLLVGLIASYLPARRATKVDPLVALREE